MIGATFCSGIGAPELAAPWVDWQFASEIEPFPRDVLHYDTAQVIEWICSPHPQLKGDIPADLLAQGYDEPIFAILDRLDADGYL